MFTYGKTKPGRVLDEILDEIEDKDCAKKARNKVGIVYHKFTRGLKELQKIEPSIRENMTFMWRDSFLNSVKDMFLPSNVKSFLLNTIHAETRESLRDKWLDDPQFSKELKKNIRAANERREKEHKEYVTAKVDSN